MSYTGEKSFALLIQINKRTGRPTGLVKPNVPTDPNYIHPTASADCSDVPPDEDWSILTEQQGGIPIQTENTADNLEIEH